MRVFSNYQLILLIFVFMSTILVSKSVNYDTMDTLYEYQTINPGYGLTSKSGKYKLDYGADGTFNILRLATDRDGNMAFDRKTGMMKTENVYSPLRPNPGNAGPMTLVDGKLTVFNKKGEEVWGPAGADDEGGNSKLVILDTGLLALYNSAGTIVGSWPDGGPAEGYVNYQQNIADKRDELQKQTNELLRIQSTKTNENKSKMDWSILVNILWTVIASTLLYYLITN